MTTPFIEDNDQTRARREHLEAIRAIVGNAYPSRFQRSNVAQSPEGEDTISALVSDETIKALVGEETFTVFRALTTKPEGEKPTPEELAAVNEGLNKIEVRVAGRIATPPRVMGKAAFVHLSDGRERLQIYLRRDDMREMPPGESDPARTVDGWELFKLLDHGDFIGVAGFLFVTKTGELSIHVRAFEFLSKALVPMPDKLHGISDPEIRQRQRYADLIASSLKIGGDEDAVEGGERQLTTREVFERRSKVITEMRRHLEAHGYVEVETPMLSPIASGAAARPFRTHHNALDIDLYLRIAPELYLKRLLVGGFERVYELNRNFRNEGISTRHSPEFTMLEFYCAYMDADGMMDFCEEMLRTITREVTGRAEFSFDSTTIDLNQPFRRLSMLAAISESEFVRGLKDDIGEPFDETWLADKRRIRKLALYLEDLKSSGEPMAVSERWQIALSRDAASPDPDETETAQNTVSVFEWVEAEIIQPTFIVDFPKPVSPLSKASRSNPAVAERFELYIAGFERANGFSELNDPAEQYERFKDQVAQRERGDDEAMQMDLDYVRALSYGMPPAAGIGIGIDRLVMLLTNRRTIRDVVLFPHMRPRHEARAEGEPEEGAGGEVAL